MDDLGPELSAHAPEPPQRTQVLQWVHSSTQPPNAAKGHTVRCCHARHIGLMGLHRANGENRGVALPRASCEKDRVPRRPADVQPGYRPENSNAWRREIAQSRAAPVLGDPELHLRPSTATPWTASEQSPVPWLAAESA